MPIWHLMIKELISGWTEKRKNPSSSCQLGATQYRCGSPNQSWRRPLQSISVIKTIYFDGLTMDKFFGSILPLKRALLCLSWPIVITYGLVHPIYYQGRSSCYDNHVKVTWVIPLPSLGNWTHFADANVQIVYWNTYFHFIIRLVVLEDISCNRFSDIPIVLGY
jgi:hypothetical protein